MINSGEGQFGWDSRRLYLILLLCQTIGPNIFVILPHKAVHGGAAGHIIGYTIAYIIFGIPLLYMEFIVAQFTSRDCIDVWKARPFLSHIGYIHIFSQVILIIYNHSVTSFVLHYLLISFEQPIPYYECGPWSRKDCDIIKLNYTINKYCTKLKKQGKFCDDIYKTYPEHRYWKRYILGLEKKNFYIAWRVCLTSGMSCAFIFLICFKKIYSVKWFSEIVTFYPMIGYLILLVGSLLQKGFVMMFDEVFDSNFNSFFEYICFRNIIKQVIIGLNIGTGISFNMASKATFRSPCYSNVVITVVTCCAVTTLTVSSLAIAACPYTFEYAVQPFRILKIPMSILFETMPRFLSMYDNSRFWLILVFSCNFVVAFSTNVILILHLIDVLAKRCRRFKHFSCLVCVVLLLLLFCVTIPILGNTGINVLVTFKRCLNLIHMCMAMTECVVFVLWYGIGKFSEDVHFMQGLPPKNYVKVIWVLSCGLLGYVFLAELYYFKTPVLSSLGGALGWWTLVAIFAIHITVVIGKLLLSAYKKKFLEVIHLDPSWGPKDEILLRSRAMFTASMMTKEYLYRQYHLQAGIVARQKMSNIRK